MRVFILTEGSKNIGFGHVTRCFSLYQAFEEKGILPTFIINGDESVKNFINNTKNTLFFNWLNDQKKALTFIKGADIVIIDSYLADLSLYEKISELAKVSVYIDDNKRLDYPKGVILNGAIYAKELNYSQKEKQIYLLGTRYIPLRKEFWDVPEKKIKKELKTIMITFAILSFN